jgi:hypothetical protein
MDPYLERHWGYVHARFIVYCCDYVQGCLPKGLRARVEERMTLESLEGREDIRVPDIRVVEHYRGKITSPAGSGGLAVADSVLIPLREPITEGYIEIRDAMSGHKVITVIEVLSRSNKLPGDGRAEYLKRRRELRDGQVSLVEIDLLRSGQRPLLFHPDQLPPAYQTPYMV